MAMKQAMLDLYIPLYLVCLAYALFKIFRRRLTNLRIHQNSEDYATVRNMLLNLEAGEIRKVIDLELSFIVDGIFSKAAAGKFYQGIGVINRIVHAILLMVAAVLVVTLDTKKHLECTETPSIHFAAGLGVVNLLVAFALVVEFLQLRKIIRSNWLLVWLACCYITEERLAKKNFSSSKLGSHHPQLGIISRTSTHALSAKANADTQCLERWRKLHLFNQKAIAWAFRFVGKPKSSHWRFKLEELSILVDTLNAVQWHYFVQFEVEKMCEAQRCQLEISNLLTDIKLEELQDYLFKKVMERYKEIKSLSDICDLRQRISEDIPQIPFKEDAGLEDVVLMCHLLTSVFELDLLQCNECGKLCENMDVIVSIGLSRYCMHLMIRRPKLMPEDPDVAQVLYTGIKQQLKALYLKTKFQAILAGELTELGDGLDVIPFAKDFLRKMSGESECKKWRLLAKVWLDIFMFIVDIADNAHPHVEQMAKGGEFLTHFWVLLGHLGGGQGYLGGTVTCA